MLAVVGLNHRTAPVAVRERLAFSEQELQDALTRLAGYGGIEGCVIISTCNRTEVYAALTVEERIDSIWRFLSAHCGSPAEGMQAYTYTYLLADAVRHLFRVSAGIDSMVLGETQILGQVKQAYKIACDAGTVNWLLNLVFQHALAVGKRVRAETGIDRNPVSISYAAVELARQSLGSLEGRVVLIVGAGKMSELTVKHLIANGIAGVIVSNRSFDRAQQLAEQFGGRAVRFDDLYRWIEVADIVISATAAHHYVIKPEPMQEVSRRREARKLFIIDIAVPRDVDPAVGHIPGVVLHDIDSLQSVVDSNLAERRRAAAAAESIIDRDVDEFVSSLGVRLTAPTVAALKKRGEEIKAKELQRAFNRLGDVSEHQAKVINALANAIVNQLLHEPVTRLKTYTLTGNGAAYAEALQKLFDLDTEWNKDLSKWLKYRHKRVSQKIKSAGED